MYIVHRIFYNTCLRYPQKRNTSMSLLDNHPCEGLKYSKSMSIIETDVRRYYLYTKLYDTTKVI